MDEFYKNVKKFWESRSKKNFFLWNNKLKFYKINFIKNNIKKDSTILDLGAGDGEIDLFLVDLVKKIVAVDFVDNIKNISNFKIETHKSNIIDFVSQTDQKFDHILIIGVMNYIQDHKNFYKSCKSLLLPGGSLIVAHQCSEDNDIIINNSVENEEYHALYPNYNTEKDILESLGFKVILLDPYPEEFNIHKNTKYKGFLCNL